MRGALKAEQRDEDEEPANLFVATHLCIPALQAAFDARAQALRTDGGAFKKNQKEKKRGLARAPRD
ncbi:hypothetical protein [Variovorax sp. PDC80]|jgi:hypothetical protein|uniref:hypothetical protein n=1 Tax=Variovorax sp. PDC80 TaxID=1882827 RepID=UPI0015A6363E|nr:hypothetical protein [Variovorax sp. PDC80]